MREIEMKCEERTKREEEREGVGGKGGKVEGCGGGGFCEHTKIPHFSTSELFSGTNLGRAIAFPHKFAK